MVIQRLGPFLMTLSLLGCTPTRPDPGTARRIADHFGEGIVVMIQDDGGRVDAEADASGLLTLPDAVRLAVQNDEGLQIALARVRVAEADADQNRLLPNPILSVALRFPESGGKPVIEAGLTAEFLSLLTRPGRVEAADDRLRAAAGEAVTAALDALAGVRERYAAVQALDALMPVLDERRNLIDRLLRLAQDRLNAGEGTRLDVTTLDAQRLELDVEIAEKRVEQRQERLALARLIGRPSGAADWRVEPLAIPPAPAGEERTWVATALDRRPEIDAGRWELAALGVDYKLTRLALLEGADVGVASERDGEWTLGPAITTPLPVFDWGQAKAKRAAALRLEAAHKLTKARRTVVEEVRKAYAEYVAARSTLELVRSRLLPAQQERRRQTEGAYQTGQTDITALIIADQDLQFARAKLIDLERRTATALIRLERAVGGPGVAARMPMTPGTTQPK